MKPTEKKDEKSAAAPKKLNLSRETIKRVDGEPLDEQTLDGIAGGGGGPIGPTGPTGATGITGGATTA